MILYLKKWCLHHFEKNIIIHEIILRKYIICVEVLALTSPRFFEPRMHSLRSRSTSRPWASAFIARGWLGRRWTVGDGAFGLQASASMFPWWSIAPSYARCRLASSRRWSSGPKIAQSWSFFRDLLDDFGRQVCSASIVSELWVNIDRSTFARLFFPNDQRPYKPFGM